jgi:hypothetical protein
MATSLTRNIKVWFYSVINRIFHKRWLWNLKRLCLVSLKYFDIKKLTIINFHIENWM